MVVITVVAAAFSGVVVVVAVVGGGDTHAHYVRLVHLLSELLDGLILIRKIKKVEKRGQQFTTPIVFSLSSGPCYKAQPG